MLEKKSETFMGREVKMRYLIYGANRVAVDFIYMFPDIDVELYADDIVNDSSFKEKSLIDIKKLHDYKNFYDKIIVCGLDKNSKEERLKSIGLKYQDDYVFPEDFFYVLNANKQFINPLGKKIVIWGTGVNSTYFSEYFTYFEPEFYIDTYNSEKSFRKKMIYKPDEVGEILECFVIIAVQDDNKIVDYLERKGMKKSIDFINANEIISTPSEMLRATIYDKHQYKLNCETPLNHMEYLTDGEIYCCCSTFMHSIGNTSFGNIKDIWNSNRHKIICLSVQNHTYTFCNKDMCPLLFGKETDVLLDMLGNYKRMEESPEVCAIGFDYTCNLKCETCRKTLRVANGSERERMMEMARIAEKNILPGTKFFIMAGDGEVFASDAYKYLYRSESMNSTPYIRILSNGTLFNKKNWEDFKKNKNGKVMLTASVDAATKNTYEKIRINGNFEKLKENMTFAGELRKSGELSYFRMNFVVQRRNYLEMPEFVRWGVEIGADEVFFTKILNWGIYSKEEFDDISMFEPDGITPKSELKTILDDPIMKERIVDLGTIKYAHQTFNDFFVHNYYMWELERKVKGLFERH